MGLNRNLLMGQNVDLKNPKAVMTVGNYNGTLYGFVNDSDIVAGAVIPNPLPNGTKILRTCVMGGILPGMMQIKPEIPVTINGKRYVNRGDAKELLTYLKDNVGKQIPVIFHFD